MQNFQIYLGIKLKAVSACFWRTGVNLLLLLGGDDSVELSFTTHLRLTLNSLADEHTAHAERGKSA